LENHIKNKDIEIAALKMRNKVIEDRTKYNFSELSNID